MSEKNEKKKRYNQKLEYIQKVEQWLAQEPSRWHFLAWRKWKRSRPVNPLMKRR